MHENEVSQFTESLWTSLLGLDVRRTNHAAPQKDNYLTACVQINGAWQGAVALNCPPALAKRVAAIMFGTEQDALKPDEIHDAIGELANITGGYIKTMLPGPCQLSLPSVGNDLAVKLFSPENHVVCQVAFECQDQPLLVTLLKQEENPAKKAGVK